MATGTADTAYTFPIGKGKRGFLLFPISRTSGYIALLVWLAVLIGLIDRQMEHLLFPKSQPLPKRRANDTR